MQIHLSKATRDLLLNLRDVSLFFSDCERQASVSSTDLVVKSPVLGKTVIPVALRAINLS